jgi:hypothetical protein
MSRNEFTTENVKKNLLKYGFKPLDDFEYKNNKDKFKVVDLQHKNKEINLSYAKFNRITKKNKNKRLTQDEFNENKRPNYIRERKETNNNNVQEEIEVPNRLNTKNVRDILRKYGYRTPKDFRYTDRSTKMKLFDKVLNKDVELNYQSFIKKVKYDKSRKTLE